MARLLAKVTAILIRALQPTLPVSQQHVEERAARYANKLEASTPGLRQDLLLIALRREVDLMYEEVALEPNGLRLQAKIIRLAKENPIAKEILDACTDATMRKVLVALLTELSRAPAGVLHINLNSSRPAARITFADGEELLTLPRNLVPPLLGLLNLLEEVGISVLRPALPAKDPLPDHVTVERVGEQGYTLRRAPL